MPEIVTHVGEFRSERAWGARDLVEIAGATVRLHWTDRPYRWHVNDGAEAFVVLDGQVDMYWRSEGKEQVVRLGATDMFIAQPGDEHVAHPVGEARILVVEKKGSV